MKTSQLIAAAALSVLAAAGAAHAETYEGVTTIVSTADRAKVNEEAVAKAHDPLQSLDRRAFYRDTVPAAYNKPTVSFTRQAAAK